MRKVLAFALGLSVLARGIQFVGNVVISNFFGPEFFRVWQTVWNGVVAGQQFAPLGINLIVARGSGSRSSNPPLILLGMTAAVLIGSTIIIRQPGWLLIADSQHYVYSGASWLLMCSCSFLYAAALQRGSYNRYSMAANSAPVGFALLLPAAYYFFMSPHELMLLYSAVSFVCAWIAVGELPRARHVTAALRDITSAARSIYEGVALMLPNAIFSLQVAFLLVVTAQRSAEANAAFAYLVPIINVHSIVPNAVSNILIAYKGGARRGLFELSVATAVFGVVMYLGGAEILFELMGFRPAVSNLYLGLAVLGAVTMVVARLLISTLMADGQVGRANMVAGVSAAALVLLLYVDISIEAATWAYCGANCAALAAAAIALLQTRRGSAENLTQVRRGYESQ